jgi:hypothetical protein
MAGGSGNDEMPYPTNQNVATTLSGPPYDTAQMVAGVLTSTPTSLTWQLLLAPRGEVIDTVTVTRN